MPSSKILITGAAGFIGSQFVKVAQSQAYKVISVDKLSHFETRPEHPTIPSETRIERDHLLDWLAQEKPQLSAIVHLGACTDTTCFDKAYLNQTNLVYSQNIWSYATAHQIPLIYASSAATYGSGDMGYDDNEDLIPKLKPLNPYGQSKQDFDFWALAQEQKGQHPPSWCGFKFFNVYGYGERHKKAMSSVALQAFDQIQKQGFVRLFQSHKSGIADGEQKRDFIFVEDVVDVLTFALKNNIARGIYNLGTGTARSFLDLVRAVFDALNKKENITFIPTPEAIRENYQYFTEAQMNRLRNLGYTQPFTALETGVQKYVRQLLTP